AAPGRFQQRDAGVSGGQGRSLKGPETFPAPGVTPALRRGPSRAGAGRRPLAGLFCSIWVPRCAPSRLRGGRGGGVEGLMLVGGGRQLGRTTGHWPAPLPS